jgi:hypothetical protein
MLAEEELVRRDGYDGAQAEQEVEDFGPDSTENWHALQEFDPCFLHGDTPEAVIMIGGGSVRKEVLQ